MSSGCGSLDKASQMQMFEYQNLDYITTGVANPIVINTWYTALATTRNVKAHYLVVEQTNAGAAAETIVVELTVNGVVFTRSRVYASGVLRYVYFNNYGALTDALSDIQILSPDYDQSAPLETRSLQVRVRQTTAVDLVAAQIEVNMVYATREVSA